MLWRRRRKQLCVFLCLFLFRNREFRFENGASFCISTGDPDDHGSLREAYLIRTLTIPLYRSFLLSIAHHHRLESSAYITLELKLVWSFHLPIAIYRRPTGTPNITITLHVVPDQKPLILGGSDLARLLRATRPTRLVNVLAETW